MLLRFRTTEFLINEDLIKLRSVCTGLSDKLFHLKGCFSDGFNMMRLF